MANNRMTPTTIPEDFTLALVLVDALPVLFFGGSAIILSLLFGSRLFLLGALLCLVGGAGKVLWKLIVVLRKKNIWFLFVQMRILMPVGFLLMVLSVVIGHRRIRGAAVLAGITSFPSGILFLIGILGMVLMIICAKKLDSADVKANWIEQAINGVAQGAIFVGLLLLL